tara:strand:- start:3300 stop:4340 length:1041 start_codon:yes stop_codon:yes gene_type:complete
MLRFVAELLHPTETVNDSHFPAPQIFWDRLVQIGSSQLLLPAIYGALKRKKLVNHAPKDLLLYLQEITDLNYERNSAILKQVDFLSKIFNKNQIDHVFLKGAAMLITKTYEAVSERMVGDIDILVAEKDLLSAQQLLINEDFEAVSNEFSFTKGVLPDNYQKHLKRIKHSSYIAAVEIHRHLLIKENHLILTKDVLQNKVQSRRGLWIPSEQHLWQHAILNWQYNDSGMIRNYLAFRSVLDVLYLEPSIMIAKLETSPNSIKHFYTLLSLYYTNYKSYYPLKKIVYKWQLQSKFFDNLYSFFKNLIALVYFGLSRTFIFLSSNIYRKRVISKRKLLWQRILKFWNK